jgi:S-adenosylmethionine decarboxylase
MKKTKGKHLIVDAYGVESKLLENKKTMKRLLEEMPARLGMRIFRKPIVGEISSPNYPTTGLSGFVILYESHISFHTWPEENYVAIDVYSCRDFNGKEAVKYLKEYLGTQSMKVKSIMRG